MNGAPVNPYTHRGPVTGEDFYGRQWELGRILQFLGTKPLQSVSIYGEQRIGKSSLLRQLASVVGPQRLPGLTFVFLDMQRVFTPQDFVARVTASLGLSGQEYADLEDVLSQQKRPVVLCLDEFGKALANPAFDADFYDFMRSIAQSGGLALVLTTLRPLAEAQIPSQADVSRFFNIFQPLALGMLPEEEARQLIVGPAERAGQPFSDAEVSFVLRTADGHPFKTQVLCYRLFEAKTAGPVDFGRVQEAYEQELRDTEGWGAGRLPKEPGEPPPRQRAPALPRAERWDPIINLLLLFAGVSFLITVVSNASSLFVFTLLFLFLAMVAMVAQTVALFRARG